MVGAMRGRIEYLSVYGEQQVRRGRAAEAASG
jgi:hypothetical protein